MNCLKLCCLPALPKVMNRDELLNSLEDIAEAFDMRVRPYSATSGQSLFAVVLCTAHQPLFLLHLAWSIAWL